MDIIKYIPITKRDDDQRMVYGWASTPDLDSDGEVITLEAISKALPDYMKFPTLREMHQPKVAGVVQSGEIVDDERGKGLFIGAKVVSDEAWKMVKEGAYRAFSIGGRVMERIENIVTDLQLVEVSLVDVPANPHAVVTLYKSNGLNLDSLKRIEFTDNPLAETLRKGVIINMEKTQTSTDEVQKDAEVTETQDETSNKETEVTDEEVTETTDETEEKSEEVLDTKLAKVSSMLDRVDHDQDDLTKSVDAMTKDISKVADTVVKVAAFVKELESRVVALEKQPAPVKSKASYVVGKTVADTQRVTSDPEIVKAKKDRLAELDAIMVNKGKSFFAKMGYAEEAQRLHEELSLIEG